MDRLRNIVILTGAGISAESGLRTFRAEDGLWEDHPVEEVATPRGFRRDPDLVQRFYDERRANIRAAQPNPAHAALARLDSEWAKRQRGELLTAALLATGVYAVAANARDSAPYYRAQLAAPAASEHVIAGGVLWFCEGSGCAAAKGNSRPVIVCKHLAGETGAVVHFSYDGKDLSPGDLQRCNA